MEGILESIDYTEILLTIITAIIGFVGFVIRSYLKTRTGIDIGKFLDEKGIPDALILAKKIIHKKLKEKELTLSQLEFENQIVDDAFQMVKKKYPKWLKEYDISEQQLYEWILSKFQADND